MSDTPSQLRNHTSASSVPGDRQRAAAIGLRMLFGLIWLINAGFHAYAWLFQGGGQSAANLLNAYSGPLSHAPGWLIPYLSAVVHGIQTIGPHVVAGIMVALDLLIGLSFLLGRGVIIFALLGMAYVVFCWTTLDSFGYPYTHGQTDPGVFVAYFLVFVFVLSARRTEQRRAGALGSAGSPLTVGRILFGLLWAFDAGLKWQPYFLTHFTDQLTGVVPGQPPWVDTYLAFVISVVSLIGPQIVAVLVAVVESLLALSLLIGRGLRLSVPLGILYSLVVWSTAEAFGGPYTSAGTGVRGNVVGNVIIYVLIFLYLGLVRERPARAARLRLVS
jgi:hypothetical protein